jgi:DNA-binding LytR/AlgR family response regulator
VQGKTFVGEQTYECLYIGNTMKIVIVEDEMTQQKLLSSYISKALDEKRIPFDLQVYSDAETFLKKIQL